MKRRNQKVMLDNKLTHDVKKVTVIIADSKQGYLGSTPTGIPDHFEWVWYSPEQWVEVKQKFI